MSLKNSIEIEIQELEQEKLELDRKIEGLKLRKSIERNYPKLGTYYSYINDDGNIYYEKWSDSESDYARFNIFNCFIDENVLFDTVNSKMILIAEKEKTRTMVSRKIRYYAEKLNKSSYYDNKLYYIVRGNAVKWYVKEFIGNPEPFGIYFFRGQDAEWVLFQLTQEELLSLTN